MIRNLKISHRPVLLGIVFSVRSPCCCPYSSRSKNRDRLRPNKRRVVEYVKPVRQLLYDIQKHQVAFLSGAAEAFATERQILEEIRSARRWMVVTEKNFKQPTALLDWLRNGPQQNP